jgi:hypothetical protein
VWHPKPQGRNWIQIEELSYAHVIKRNGQQFKFHPGCLLQWFIFLYHIYTYWQKNGVNVPKSIRFTAVKTICCILLIKYYLGDQIKKNGMGGVCGIYRGSYLQGSGGET